MIWGVDSKMREVAMFCGESHRAVVIQSNRPSRGEQLEEMRALVIEATAIDPDPILVIEESVVAGARNIRSTIKCAETVGMLLSLPYPTYLVEIGKWKKNTVGNGNAKKSDVADWLREAHPVYSSLCGGNQDLVDAASIYVYGEQVVDAYKRGTSVGGPTDL